MSSSKSTLSRFDVALITGGGGGLGKAMAQSLIKSNKKVILAGRTQSNLEETAKELGPSVIATYVIDFAKLGDIAPFVKKVVTEHPEVDCVINNAGIQKPMRFDEDPISDDLLTAEIDVNITSLVMMCNLFSAHLRSKSSSVLMNIASGLSYVPLAAVPIYCATKAFVKSFTMSLQVQMKDTSLFIVEIAPPLVESNLHRDHESGDAKESPIKALTQEEFMTSVEKGWAEGSHECGAGFTLKQQSEWHNAFGGMWKGMNQLK